MARIRNSEWQGSYAVDGRADAVRMKIIFKPLKNSN